jgi:serine phosphatase RsbU (regulator of sigma subunit)
MIQELVEANENLEEKVQERTEEIAAQNEELIQNQEEILVQRGFIEQKVKELQLRDQQITNSIQSAFLIQNAILPYPEKLENLLHNCFVLYRPKDLVSGDFFWLNQVAGKTFLVVADCTGHGVPGAFMTLIGNTILDKIIRVWDIYDPALILERLHEDVRIMLRQEETGNNNGMDVGILCWDTESKGEEISFTYAGAKQGLYYIEPNSTTLKILKGVRKAIGGIQPKDLAFENDYFTVSKQTMIYLGSDGLPDQNDVNRKRFGDKRLQELFTKFHKSSVTKQGEILEEQLEKHMEDTTQRDDILVVGFRVS